MTKRDDTGPVWFTTAEGNVAPAVAPPWERENAKTRRNRRRRLERQGDAGDGDKPNDGRNEHHGGVSTD